MNNEKTNIAIRFYKHYIVEKLFDDMMCAISVSEWYDKRSNGGLYQKWNAIPLYSVGGRIGKKEVDKHIALNKCEYKPTEIMAHCGYFREILDPFKTSKLRIRLMRLEPGGDIGRHTDPAYGYDKKILRLHIPIVTNDKVFFELNDNRLIMNPGTLWYLDTTKPHSVKNDSCFNRVHLVMDFEKNDWMCDFINNSQHEKTFS